MADWNKVLERLMAYEPKALGWAEYRNRGLCCAVSAVLPSAAELGTGGWGIDSLLNGDEGKQTVPQDVFQRIQQEASTLGLTAEELGRLQLANDDIADETPQERYQRVMAWVAIHVDGCST